MELLQSVCSQLLDLWAQDGQVVPPATSLGAYVAEFAMLECAVAFVVQEADSILIWLPPFWDKPCAWHLRGLKGLPLLNRRVRACSFVLQV